MTPISKRDLNEERRKTKYKMHASLYLPRIFVFRSSYVIAMLFMHFKNICVALGYNLW